MRSDSLKSDLWAATYGLIFGALVAGQIRVAVLCSTVGGSPMVTAVLFVVMCIIWGFAYVRLGMRIQKYRDEPEPKASFPDDSDVIMPPENPPILLGPPNPADWLDPGYVERGWEG